MADYHINALEDVLRRLAGSPWLDSAADRIAGAAAAIAMDLRNAVLAEVRQFSESRNPDLLPELGRHVAGHTQEIVRLLRGGSPGDFAFVQEHAHRRAEQRFPLEATLHAYRSGHKVYSRWLRNAVLAVGPPAEGAQDAIAAVADFSMEYTDAISTLFAGAYAAHTQLLADVAGDQRAELLQILLNGHDEADGRVARILRDAGFQDKRLSYCVVLARSVDPAEMLNATRSRRLADAVDKVVADLPARRVIDVFANKVTMVVAEVRRESGWTAPRSSFAGRLAGALALVGNAALIGISNDVPSTSHIPSAYRAASTALDLARVSRRVVQFADIPMQRLLLHLAGEDFTRILPQWVGPFHAADRDSRGALSATLRAYAGADMNLLKAAQALGVHPNTVYARFQRIFDVSGLQARSFEGLTELLIVAGCDPQGL